MGRSTRSRRTATAGRSRPAPSRRSSASGSSTGWCAARGVPPADRFHPLFANQLLRAWFYRREARHDDCVAPGVQAVDPFDGMHSAHRNSARKAQRAGAEVFVAVEGSADLGEFVEAYEATVARAGASPSYFFDHAYWRRLETSLRDRLVPFDARIEGELVASALCLAALPWMHYHFGTTSSWGEAPAPATSSSSRRPAGAKRRGSSSFTWVAASVGGRTLSFASRSGSTRPGARTHRRQGRPRRARLRCADGPGSERAFRLLPRLPRPAATLVKPENPRRVALIVLTLLLLAGTTLAFGVPQTLKLERSPVTGPRFDQIFSPTCRCRTHTAQLSFRLRRADRVDAVLVDGKRGRRQDARERPTTAAGRVTFLWNGRDEAGQVVPDGRYRLRVHLRQSRRTILSPDPGEGRYQPSEPPHPPNHRAGPLSGRRSPARPLQHLLRHGRAGAAGPHDRRKARLNRASVASRALSLRLVRENCAPPAAAGEVPPLPPGGRPRRQLVA